MMWLLCACGGHIGDAATANAGSAHAMQEEHLPASLLLSVDDAGAMSVQSVALPRDFGRGRGAFADCFSYAPGIRFAMTNGTKWLIVEEAFQGQAAFGAAELRDDGTRVGTQYYAIESGQIRLLGDSATDIAGTTSSTSVYFNDYRIPLTLALGASVYFSGLSTTTNTPEPFDTAVDIHMTQQRSKITYLGQETLHLGGHTFTDVCKLESAGSSVDSHDADNAVNWAQLLWVARGYGVIQSEDIDVQGRAVPGSRNQLMKIIAAR